MRNTFSNQFRRKSPIFKIKYKVLQIKAKPKLKNKSTNNQQIKAIINRKNSFTTVNSKNNRKSIINIIMTNK